MGLRTQTRRKAEVFTAWLPGFDPEPFEDISAQAGLLPNVNPTPVALVAAALVHVTLGQDEWQSKAQYQEIEAVYVEAKEDDTFIDSDVDVECVALDPAPAEIESLLDVQESVPEPDKEWPDFDSTRYAPGASVKDRIEQNLKAIERMLALRGRPEQVTDEDRHQMLAYSGWGGAARLFEDLPGNSFAPQRDTLKAMVSDEEFVGARSSVTNAFYTDVTVIRAMWAMIRRLGFTGGRVIEPAAGTGLFLAEMPKDLAVKSEITAVELDKLTAGLLELTFAGLGVNVQCSGIEKADVPHGFYDLAISNVPFGDHKTLDTSQAGYSEWSIHNYFFGKAIDLVRPGGLVVMLTSAYTMDSLKGAHREWINAHAELVGAFRLPDTAFKHSAATDVVTDILVLKKRAVPMFSAANAWARIKQAPLECMKAGQNLQHYPAGSRTMVDKDRSINQWYVQHPHAIIGELVLTTGQYGRPMVKTVFGGTHEQMGQRLNALAQELPEAIYAPMAEETDVRASLLLTTVTATKSVKPGSFVISQGHICIGQDALSWIDVDDAYSGKARERILGLVGIRDVARALIAEQIQTDEDAGLKRLQTELNVKYDAFVAKHGNITDPANVRLFRSDPDCPLVLSLERYDEESETYKKADIFSKRTAGKKTPPEKVDNVKDAMLVALGIFGRIHIADMAKRFGVTAKEVVRELKDSGLAYVDPETGRWLPADEYLSGNIRSKIATAIAGGKKFAGNVEALRRVTPAKLGPGEIEVRLGAPWVPIDIVEQFAAELVGVKSNSNKVAISYNAESATWSLVGDINRKYQGDWQLNNRTWGTDARCALDLLEAALNHVPPKVTKTVDGRSVLNRTATMAAREKYEAIRQEFKAWAYRDDVRRDRLVDIYNTQFNQIVERRFDGSHLVLYGMSPVITPYTHQLDAIWRIVSGGNTLLAHVVGAGKTFTMIASAMEMRRIGKANKPLLVVPNHLLIDFVAECVRYYPTAKLLMATSDDFAGDNRREFVARVATGDWDAVVMTQSTFERIPVSPEMTKEFVNELLAQVRNSMKLADERNAKRSVKQCEKLLKALEAKFERALNESAKDELVYFEELGIDYLMYDEAHALKNLMRVSKMPSIAGLSNASSNRAFDAWVKTSLIMKARGGREEGIVLSSATPISNSLAELHVCQKFLQPNTLKAMGLYEFDAWAATFGEAVTAMEISPDGGGYRLSTRFAKFVNVPDLMAIFRQVADIKTRSMLRLPTPHIKTGKPAVVTSKANQALLDYTAELVERAEKIRGGHVKPEEDNMLSVTNCGRKAALDMRLIDPTLPFDPNGKVAKLVENVVRIWHETAQERGTQLVFCDLSTPSSTGFSVYNDARDRLIAAGIPAEQIQFIHDHDSNTAKAKLFRDVRAGRVRVLFGSTLKMGTGTNVQKRLKAVHQMDPPWRSSDVEQRDGRGLRAGNMWEEIELLRYVTESSFDVYVYQLLETKARFIEQVMTSGSSLRNVEDMAMGALTYAEIKALASGNPLVLEKATVDAEVMKYSILRDSWEQERWTLSNRVDSHRWAIKSMNQTMGALRSHATMVQQGLSNGFVFMPAAGSQVQTKADSALETDIGQHILHVSKTFAAYGEKIVGEIAGMNLVFNRGMGLVVALESTIEPNLKFEVNRTGTPITDVFGTGKLVLDLVMSLASEPKVRLERMARMLREIDDFQASLNAPYPHAQKLTDLVQRQRAIESELELDKDEAGVEAVAEATV